MSDFYKEQLQFYRWVATIWVTYTSLLFAGFLGYYIRGALSPLVNHNLFITVTLVVFVTSIGLLLKIAYIMVDIIHLLRKDA